MFKKLVITGLLSIGLMFVTACGSDDVTSTLETETTAATTVEETTAATTESTTAATVATIDESSLYSTIAGEYTFTSGAGGWMSTMSVSSDGSFTGEYSDSEMGEIGDGYPDGTVYQCKFSGKFSAPSKVSETEFQAKVEELKTEEEEGAERIEDNMRFVAASPYGLDDVDTVKFYSPESKTSELPEGFIQWCNSSEAFISGTPEKLSFWGIYNVNGDQGWFSSIK